MCSECSEGVVGGVCVWCVGWCVGLGLGLGFGYVVCVRTVLWCVPTVVVSGVLHVVHPSGAFVGYRLRALLCRRSLQPAANPMGAWVPCFGS
jgi:hypothetical protein